MLHAQYQRYAFLGQSPALNALPQGPHMVFSGFSFCQDHRCLEGLEAGTRYCRDKHCDSRGMVLVVTEVEEAPEQRVQQELSMALGATSWKSVASSGRRRSPLGWQGWSHSCCFSIDSFRAASHLTVCRSPITSAVNPPVIWDQQQLSLLSALLGSLRRAPRQPGLCSPMAGERPQGS